MRRVSPRYGAMRRIGGNDVDDVVTQEDELRPIGVSLPRARFLGWATAAFGAAATGGGAIAAFASANSHGSLAGRDREVLEFALTLEQLQTTFYSEALSAGNLTGEARQFAQTVGAEEQAHLRYLHQELGASAGKASRFRFGDAAASDEHFVAAAVALEETGLAAYNGQAENVTRATLKSVARVISVEARHAAWARGLAGLQPAPVAADVPISAATAMARLRKYLG
jgi:rubrerythrin